MGNYKSFQTVSRKDALDDIYHIKNVLMRLDIELEILAVGTSEWKKHIEKVYGLLDSIAEDVNN